MEAINVHVKGAIDIDGSGCWDEERFLKVLDPTGKLLSTGSKSRDGSDPPRDDGKHECRVPAGTNTRPTDIVFMTPALPAYAAQVCPDVMDFWSSCSLKECFLRRLDWCRDSIDTRAIVNGKMHFFTEKKMQYKQCYSCKSLLLLHPSYQNLAGFSGMSPGQLYWSHKKAKGMTNSRTRVTRCTKCFSLTEVDGDKSDAVVTTPQPSADKGKDITSSASVTDKEAAKAAGRNKAAGLATNGTDALTVSESQNDVVPLDSDWLPLFQNLLSLRSGGSLLKIYSDCVTKSEAFPASLLGDMEALIAEEEKVVFDDEVFAKPQFQFPTTALSQEGLREAQMLISYQCDSVTETMETLNGLLATTQVAFTLVCRTVCQSTLTFMHYLFRTSSRMII